MLRYRNRNVVRERNLRGFHLFLQNLKSILSLFLRDELSWTENLTKETSQRLQGTLATLVLVEQDVSSHNNSILKEHLIRLRRKTGITARPIKSELI